MADKKESFDIEPGDVVRLKSGGIPMTVSSTDGNEATLVYWNEGQNEFASWEDVNLITLEKVS